MKLTSIPASHLAALGAGCSGLPEALSNVAADPTASIVVLRHKEEEEPSRWSLRLTVGAVDKVFVLDSSNLATMRAAVPIFLVDLVREIQRENPVALAAGLMGVFGEMLPFIRNPLVGRRN